ncbi:hypothetical protein [Nannocystis radixulma]|uniref:Uncharacterized protein n=1 Tax=Nannocystis radixulma TaxID=2995305 RepID=A0ABT5B7C0_9BACT|nr:hypothetical protein [Nannocystis radixulma]MDC0670016.1 hypothetical protein [Nannocystis radixulma]
MSERTGEVRQVCRWMLHPSEARYYPFDALGQPRRGRPCVPADRVDLPACVIVNNEAEGSSPRTNAKLAARIVELGGFSG